MAIIKSLLDTDLYKYTMGQVALHQFPWVNVKYEFKCRNDAAYGIEHLLRIREEVQNFCDLMLTKEELNYLSEIRFFKKSYIDFLKLYKPDISHFNADLVDGELRMTVEGPYSATVRATWDHLSPRATE